MDNQPPSGFPVRLYARGTFIFRQGGPSTFGGIINSGQVAVIKEVEGEEIVLATLSRGAIVGEMALVSDLARTASVVALEDTELVIVERAKFRQAIEHSPVLIQSLLASLVERLAQTSERVRLQRRLPDLCLALANLLQASLDDNPPDREGNVSIPLDRMVQYSRAAMRLPAGEVEEIIQSLAMLDLVQVRQGVQGRELKLSKQDNLLERAIQALGPQRERPISQQAQASMDPRMRRRSDKYIGIYDLAAELNTSPQTLCRMLAKGEMPETMVSFSRPEALAWAEDLQVPGECLAGVVAELDCDDAPSRLEALLEENAALLSPALAALDQENLSVLLVSASPTARRTLWEYVEADSLKGISEMLGKTSGAGPARFAGAVNVLGEVIQRLKTG